MTRLNFLIEIFHWLPEHDSLYDWVSFFIDYNGVININKKEESFRLLYNSKPINVGGIS